MDRRTFLVTLAGVAAAPQLARRLIAQDAIVRPYFLYRDNSLAHLVERGPGHMEGDRFVTGPVWYIYPVMTAWGLREVRSSRELTADEVRALALEQLPVAHVAHVKRRA